jgi:hypothetical protein
MDQFPAIRGRGSIQKSESFAVPRRILGGSLASASAVMRYPRGNQPRFLRGQNY